MSNDDTWRMNEVRTPNQNTEKEETATAQLFKTHVIVGNRPRRPPPPSSRFAAVAVASANAGAYGSERDIHLPSATVNEWNKPERLGFGFFFSREGR